MVSIWLTAIKGCGESSEMKKTGFIKQSRFSLNTLGSGERLLAILLDTGGAQSRKAMLVD
jgi:hypothetical protein